MMSEQKPTLTHEGSKKILDDVHSLLHHCNNHVYKLSVKTVQFEQTCEWCQLELKRMMKKSDNPVPVALDGKPVAAVSMTTVLCALGMHQECGRDYVLTQQFITIHCLCQCHNKAQSRITGKRKSFNTRRLITVRH